MTPSLFRTAGLLLAGAFLATSANAQVDPLDPTFGHRGMRHYGFQAVPGSGSADRAVVACARPDDTLTVMGVASDQRRIVTIRLLPNGDLDRRFSDDGKQSFELPGVYNDFVPGLCQPDGHLAAARTVIDANGEGDLELFRVDRNTGLPDPSFGHGGVVRLDLDTWVPGGLRETEMPLSLNVLPNGDLALGGLVQLRNGGWRGFVAILAGNGTVRVARVLDNVRGGGVFAVIPAPDGRLWAFGTNGRISGAYRATLNPHTLAWEGVLELAAPARHGFYAGAARAVDADTVAMAVVALPPGAQPNRAMLAVFRAQSASLVALPTAMRDGEPLPVAEYGGAQGINILPGRRVLYGAMAQNAAGGEPTGLYLARVQLGQTANEDAVDPYFGQGGAHAVGYASKDGTCKASHHGYARMTPWLGKTALVGRVDAGCDDGAGTDYLVTRILTQ